MKKYLFCFSLAICLIAAGFDVLQAKDQVHTKITGMNPRESPGPQFRPKVRDIIPSAYGGIVRLAK